MTRSAAWNNVRIAPAPSMALMGMLQLDAQCRMQPRAQQQHRRCRDILVPFASGRTSEAKTGEMRFGKGGGRKKTEVLSKNFLARWNCCS